MGAQLVILAAGISRRFGGLKQLTPVAPGGEAIMDFTAYDARRAGFDEVVLVIRREIEAAVREHVEEGFGRHVAVRYVHQELDDLPGGFRPPAGRARPWGTVHALLAATGVLDGTFAVANADDVYGRPALRAIGDFLARPATAPPTWAMVGYAAADTLPAHGAVTRALVHAGGGYLESLEEVHGVRRRGDAVVRDTPGGPRAIPGSTLVSMNLWGFDAHALDDFARRFRRFLAAGPGGDDEYVLPQAVADAVAGGAARVQVLDAKSPWCGVTRAADLDAVRATLAGLTADGVYPEGLWT